MMPSGTSYPSSPFTTSLTVPSPPTAATTSTPVRAARAAYAAAAPASKVIIGSTKWPLSRTQVTRCRTSGRSARTPCTTSAMCLELMRLDSAYHAPALVEAVLTFLSGKRRVLDCTLGGGGHSLALLNGGAKMVVAVDRDPDAVAAARERLAQFEASGRFIAARANYAALDGVEVLAGTDFDGILLDLGVSSHQIDAPERGFSFRTGAPLDMRMDDDAVQDAADLLNAADGGTLGSIFRDFGDEPRAMRLAREIVRRRGTKRFRTSDDLVDAIRAVFGPRSGPPDFARLFQAVRRAVNDELSGIERALAALRAGVVAGGM